MTRDEWKRRKGRTSNWIVKSRRLALYLRDNFTCQYCLRNLHGVDPKDISLDHLIPREHGGSHRNHNLITACTACNFARQDRPWRVFAGSTAAEWIDRQRKRRMRRFTTLAKAILAGNAPPPEALPF